MKSFLRMCEYNFNFQLSKEMNFTFWAHLTTWPLMTFHHGTWSLAVWTYKGSHIVSINKVLVPIRLPTFQMRSLLNFQPMLKLDFRWHLTLICDPRSSQHVKVPMLYMTQVWFQSEVFQMKPNFIFSNYLKIRCQVTYDLELSPWWSLTPANPPALCSPHYKA